MADTRFAFNPASEPTVEDDEYILLSNMNITVQVCAYDGDTTFAVNEHGQDDASDDSTFWMRDHGMFRTLRAAQEKAIEVAEAHGAQ